MHPENSGYLQLTKNGVSNDQIGGIENMVKF